MEADRHLAVSVLHDVLTKWAAAKPAATAIINHDRRQRIDWAAFDLATTALAGALLRMGFRKGDFLATSLPLLTGHIFLEYACFKIGVIHAPLDLRLKPAEVLRCLGQIRAKGFAFLSPDLGRAVQTHCPFVEQLIQFSPPQDTIQYARSFFDLTGDRAELIDLAGDSARANELAKWRARMIAHLSVRGDKWVKGGKLALRREGQAFRPVPN